MPALVDADPPITANEDNEPSTNTETQMLKDAAEEADDEDDTTAPVTPVKSAFTTSSSDASPQSVPMGSPSADSMISGGALEHPYPLHYRWTMWFNPPSKPGKHNSSSWKPRPVMTFGTVVDFWRLFNNLMPPSKLQIGSNYHMFKDGVEPNWEDGENSEGGKWLINFNRRSEAELKYFDDCWMWTVLALIGEFFEDSDEICGVVISPRTKQNRLALWTKNARNEDAVKRIGQTFKHNLNTGSSIGYQVHADCVKHGTSFRNENLFNV
jgi:translation initiation factor 4E